MITNEDYISKLTILIISDDFLALLMMLVYRTTIRNSSRFHQVLSLNPDLRRDHFPLTQRHTLCFNVLMHEVHTRHDILLPPLVSGSLQSISAFFLSLSILVTRLDLLLETMCTTLRIPLPNIHPQPPQLPRHL